VAIELAELYKLVHVWGQRQLSGLALELMTNASAYGKLDPSRQLRPVPHVMTGVFFGFFFSCIVGSAAFLALWRR